MLRLGYLFERFPSYTQTFCAREVAALRAQGFQGPVYSIRTVATEPISQNFPQTGEVIYLPHQYDDVLAEDAKFRREARRWQEEMRRLWGGEAEKRRIYEALWLSRGCEKTGASHLHVHFAGMAARTAFWLSRIANIEFSLTAHANDIFRDEPPERLAQIFSRARFVVTVSEFSRAQLVARFPESGHKIYRVYNGMDHASMPPRASEPDSPPLILSVGRAIEKKGFGDLIAACARLRGLEYQCRIIGGGPLEEELKRQVVEAGLEGRVRVEGPKREREIFEAMSRAALFVLPCVATRDCAMDNLPTVIMEAMAARLPVISTRLAGIPEMVEDGKTGFLVEPGAPEALAERIRWVLSHPRESSELGELGHQKFLHCFELGVTSRQLRGLMEAHGIGI